jgi:hypothetical protein
VKVSASGVEVVDGIIYILSDDASILYKVKHDLSIIERIVLYSSSNGVSEHIPKPDKADLEAMAQFSINGYKHLLLMGSGSKSPQRDKGFLVKLPTNYNRKHIVWEVKLSSFYQFLRSHEDITTNQEINLEGLAFGNEKVYLLNRGNPSGSQDVALSFDKAEFIEFIQGHTEGVPFPAVHKISLPVLSGIKTGFTGADFFDNRFWFTCSAEDTENAYDDGAVVGSKVGVLEIEKTDNGRFVEERIRLGRYVPIFENNELYKGKIESISVYEKDSQNVYAAISVTDSDGGASELLLLDIAISE